MADASHECLQAGVPSIIYIAPHISHYAGLGVVAWVCLCILVRALARDGFVSVHAPMRAGYVVTLLAS